MNQLNKPVHIRFNQMEFKKIELAKKYTAINSTNNMIRSCVNMGLKNMCENGQIKMVFDLNQKVDKTKGYVTQVTFDEEYNKELNKIFECVPMTPSSIIKYIIMPEIEKIIENGGWNK